MRITVGMKVFNPNHATPRVQPGGVYMVVTAIGSTTLPTAQRVMVSALMVRCRAIRPRVMVHISNGT